MCVGVKGGKTDSPSSPFVEGEREETRKNKQVSVRRYEMTNSPLVKRSTCGGGIGRFSPTVEGYFGKFGALVGAL